MAYISQVKEEPEKEQYLIGFPRGVNTTQDKSLVNDKNLIQGENIMLVVDGVTRRYGSKKMFDQGSASYVYGAGAYYNKSAGTKKFLRVANNRLQYLNGDVWTAVGATAYSSVMSTILQVYNRAYIHNGTDALTYTDGSTITTYTQLDKPTNLAVTPRFGTIAAVSGITRSSQTATLTTAAAHGLVTGDYVTVSGCAQAEYNITTQITVTSSVTFTYTVAGSPATPATGTISLTTGGATTYSYQISAFNSTGETDATTNVTITNGVDDLTSTSYNEVTWTASSGATGYNIYGRTATGTGEVYLATVYTTSYIDDGSDTKITTKPAPTTNTSGGIKAKHAIFVLGRQFCFGVTEGSTYYPTRIYYSGTVDHIDDFTIGTLGGGWVEIFANDGGEIVDIMPYQSGILIFKTNGISYLYFTSTGELALKEITRAQGGVSMWGAQAIENAILYVGQKENRIGVWTIGTQENYGSDEIRTNELSIFIYTSLVNLNRTYMSKIATFYYDNKFGFTYTKSSGTENSEGWIFDTQFGGWVKWTGDPMKASMYTIYDDGTNAKLYGCSNTDGYMIEMMNSSRNDNGTAFKSIVGTKFYNQGLYDVEKIFRNPTLWFKYINASNIRAEVWFNNVDFQGSGEITSTMNGAGMGIDMAGVFKTGDSYSTLTVSDTSAQDDIIKELTVMKMARNMGIYLYDETYNGNWIFMGLHIVYTPLFGKPPNDLEKVTLTA